jgi:hypothetical protein
MFSFTKFVRLAKATIGRAEKATDKVMPLSSTVLENPADAYPILLHLSSKCQKILKDPYVAVIC